MHKQEDSIPLKKQLAAIKKNWNEALFIDIKHFVIFW